MNHLRVAARGLCHIAAFRIAGVGLVAALAIACGEDPAAQRLRETGKELESARSRVEKLEERVAERQETVDKAQAELQKAQSALNEARERVQKLQTELQDTATDEAIFRAVQLRLLEADKLSDVAIAARVNGGVVTLSGDVPNEGVRDRAVEVAKSVPGVAAVQSEIQVKGGGE